MQLSPSSSSNASCGAWSDIGFRISIEVGPVGGIVIITSACARTGAGSSTCSGYKSISRRRPVCPHSRGRGRGRRTRRVVIVIQLDAKLLVSVRLGSDSDRCRHRRSGRGRYRGRSYKVFHAVHGAGFCGTERGWCDDRADGHRRERRFSCERCRPDRPLAASNSWCN